MVDAVSGFGTSGVSSFQQPQALTDDQKKQIQEILSKYDPNNLTADDAKSIFKAFKDAGIQPGQGLKDAISAAGFDADKLLAMVAPKDHHHHHHAQSAESATTAQTANGINVSALQQLQTILNQFDLSNLSTDQQQNLMSQLNQAGLLSTGNTINIGA